MELGAPVLEQKGEIMEEITQASKQAEATEKGQEG